MATTIDQAFREFQSNFEITNRQTSLVSERRVGVVSALKKSLSLHPEEGKVTGSWDRHSLTRYLSEGDVDVMVVLHYGKNKEWDTPDGTIRALDRFRTILDASYPSTTKRRDRNCVTMSFSEFRLDVVPAFKNDSGYYTIPDSVRQLWVPTNPFAFAERVTAVNKTMDGKFVPLIKMVKCWNRHVGWPLRSFHLESLMLRRYETYAQGYTYPSMLAVFFEALPDLLDAICLDPVMGDQVDSYLDEGGTRTRSAAITKAKAAARKAREAYDDQEKYPSVAIDEWKNVLGEFFPAYG